MRAEIAVVGSGPGGAITAALLAEAGRDVVLFEEGPHIPLESCEPFSLDEMKQKYRNRGMTVALGKPPIVYVEGQCVGGGSEINSGLYHRTPPDILDEWRREFRFEADLDPHFIANERDLSVSKLTGSAPAASLKLEAGAKQLGWSSLEVPRWFRGDQKQSMSKTFIPRALKAGCQLQTGTRVDRIRRYAGRWSLGEWEADTVFVCCGAVHTPALLRRSGITRNVGNTLRLHPTIKVIAQFPDEVNAPGVPVHQVKEFAPRFSFGCSISTRPHLAMAMAEDLPAVDAHWRQMAVYYAMTRGGRGTVRTLPGFRDPLVRYHLSPADLREVEEGQQRLSECLNAAGAMKLYPQEPVHLMTIHLFSSCPMGEDARRSATDSFGRVHNVPGLYISDASLLCTAPGVNPQGTIMALARRNALKFLGDL